VLIHGDFRNGNLMVTEQGLSGVLDWELSHLGDPREDLGWICVNSWRFGESRNPVGGFGAYQQLLDGYHGAGGVAVTLEDVKYWELLGTLKWGIMCMMMYGAFASGGDPSVERATIGRRVSETEIDLITLFEGLDHA
jgi:aminoglycoside phosphotransferase (APT) family kinase protein